MDKLICNLSDGRQLIISYAFHEQAKYYIEWEGFNIGYVYLKESSMGKKFDKNWVASTDILNLYLDEISAVILSSWNEH